MDIKRLFVWEINVFTKFINQKENALSLESAFGLMGKKLFGKLKYFTKKS